MDTTSSSPDRPRPRSGRQGQWYPRVAPRRVVGGRGRVAAAMAVAVAAVVSGCTQDVAGPGLGRVAGEVAGRAGAPDDAGVLYVLEADSASVRPGARTARLELSAVDGRVLWFDDRPERHAGSETVEEFVGRWAAEGFVADPPNATLQAGAGSRGYAVELSAPRLEGTTLVFDVAALDGGPLPVGPLGSVSLFVDDGGEVAYQPLVLQVSGVQPGQAVAVEVGGGGWFTTGAPGASSGVSVVSDAGPVPVEQVSVSSSQVRVLTSADGAGGATVSLTVSVFVAASEGPGTITLRSTSDPGVTVAAALDDAAPQVVNQTATPFPW